MGKIKEQELYIAKARKLFVEGKIEYDNFFKLKKEYLTLSNGLNDELTKVKIKLSCVERQLNSFSSFDKILHRFNTLNVSGKKHLIDFVPPGNIDI